MPLNKLHYLDWLRGFVAVGNHFSFRKAAEELCVTQSAVSKQVLSLEALLGSKLFIRNPRSVEFTETGELLYFSVRESLINIQRAMDDAKGTSDSQIVLINCSVGVAGLWLLPRLSAFQHQHPDYILEVVSEDKSLASLESASVDIAIRYGHRRSMPEESIFLFQELLAPALQPALKMQSESVDLALSKHTLLEYHNKKTPWLSWRSWLEGQNIEILESSRSTRFNQYDQLIHAAVAGQGVALGRVPLILDMIEEGLLATVGNVSNPGDHMGYWLIPGNSALVSPANEVVEWIKEEASYTRKRIEQFL